VPVVGGAIHLVHMVVAVQRELPGQDAVLTLIVVAK